MYFRILGIPTTKSIEKSQDALCNSGVKNREGVFCDDKKVQNAVKRISLKSNKFHILSGLLHKLFDLDVLLSIWKIR